MGCGVWLTTGKAVVGMDGDREKRERGVSRCVITKAGMI